MERPILSAVHHIAVIGTNYEASRHFYVELLGFEVVREVYRAEYKVIENMFLDNNLGEYSVSVYFINEKDRDDYEDNRKYNLDLETSKLYKKGVILNYLYMWDSSNIKNSNDIEQLFKY